MTRPTSVNSQTVPYISHHISAVHSGDRVTVANLRTSEIHVLEGSGVTIWGYIDGHNSAAQISTFVFESYLNANMDEVTQRVFEFLDSLIELGLITARL